MICRVVWYIRARFNEARADHAENVARRCRERAEKFFHMLGLQ